MSNLHVNIRIFCIHFQINKNWKPAITYNSYHSMNNYPDGKWSIYKFFNWI